MAIRLSKADGNVLIFHPGAQFPDPFNPGSFVPLDDLASPVHPLLCSNMLPWNPDMGEQVRQAREGLAERVRRLS